MEFILILVAIFLVAKWFIKSVLLGAFNEHDQTEGEIKVTHHHHYNTYYSNTENHLHVDSKNLDLFNKNE